MLFAERRWRADVATENARCRCGRPFAAG
jgi:hypothetical protein